MIYYHPREGTHDKGRRDLPVDPYRCRAAVMQSGAGHGGYHQCSRSVFEGTSWCRQHLRMAVAAGITSRDIVDERIKEWQVALDVISTELGEDNHVAEHIRKRLRYWENVP